MTRLGAWTVEEYDVVTSTNDVARQAARSHAADHTAFVATRQSGGRGRGDHAWTSPPGGLYVSLLLRDLDAGLAPLLPLVAGEALRATLAAAARDVTFWLKWPNDVLAAPRGEPRPLGKLGGVLVESASSGGGIDWAVVGIGANLAVAPHELPSGTDPPAVSLSQWLDAPPTPQDLVDPLLGAVNDALYACGAAPERFVRDVERHLAYRDEEVELTHTETHAPGWQGTLTGLSPSGALRLRTAHGERVLDHWDVARLRPRA